MLQPYCSPRAATQHSPGYSLHAAREATVSLGSQSRPVNLQVRSENPGSLGMGIGGNVDLHPADAALGARLFASLRALGAGAPGLALCSLSGQVNLLEPKARCFRPGAFKKGAFGRI